MAASIRANTAPGRFSSRRRSGESYSGKEVPHTDRTHSTRPRGEGLEDSLASDPDSVAQDTTPRRAIQEWKCHAPEMRVRAIQSLQLERDPARGVLARNSTGRILLVRPENRRFRRINAG